MDDRTKAAFASAADCAKQLITLSTAILTLEVAFAKNILPAIGPVAKALIAASWVAPLLSVLAGIWTLLALTGTLGAKKDPSQGAINDANIARPAMGQVALFALGLALTVAFGFTVF